MSPEGLNAMTDWLTDRQLQSNCNSEYQSRDRKTAASQDASYEGITGVMTVQDKFTLILLHVGG
jgi:hypothetical protein